MNLEFKFSIFKENKKDSIFVNLKWVEYKSEEYEKSLDLREEVLRKPLGLKLEREILREENARILTAWVSDECIGTMIMLEEDSDTARMKAVAVSDDYQGKGLGKIMVKEFENEAKRIGFRKVFLHARKVVISFYEKLGYEAYGDEFYEVTIPHRTMTKLLLI